MTATEVFESVTNGGSSDFAALVGVLNEHGPWCLIGGLAVNCYVEPVFTIDVDIVVVADKLATIRAELAAAGFSRNEFPPSLNASRRESQLRIQLTTDPRYQEFLKETQVREVLGEQVPVESLANLEQGKIWSWSDPKGRFSKRKKDELDLIRIAENYPDLRHLMPQDITDQLSE